jgi:hypothetical protein
MMKSSRLITVSRGVQKVCHDTVGRDVRKSGERKG